MTTRPRHSPRRQWRPPSNEERRGTSGHDDTIEFGIVQTRRKIAFVLIVLGIGFCCFVSLRIGGPRLPMPLNVDGGRRTRTKSSEKWHNSPSQLRLSEFQHSHQRHQRHQQVCFSPDCFSKAAKLLDRAFPDRTNRSEWCLSNDNVNHNHNHNHNHNATKRGLLLVKVPKAASSTVASAVLRLAHRNHCNLVQWEHRKGFHYADAAADKSRSFLLTSVRDPASRLVSHVIYREVSYSDQRRNATIMNDYDDWLLHQLQNSTSRRSRHFGSIQDGQGGFTVQFTSPTKLQLYSAWSRREPTRVQNVDQLVSTVTSIVQTYDFIVVVDRMDESLVALALVLGVDIGDLVLAASSKVAGEYAWDATRLECIPLQAVPHRDELPSKVQRYLLSDEWYAANYGDYLLHAAAHQSLNKTIQRLGQDRFQAALEEYRRLRRLVREQCHPKFPCSAHGKPQLQLAARNCYIQDLGCGYPCVDKVMKVESS